MRTILIWSLVRFCAALTTLSATIAQAQETKLYWGDTHHHTNLSPDAYVQGNTSLTPDDAFRFAKGAPVIDPKSRAKIRLDTPLDFLVVTDHAEYVGIPKLIWQGDPSVMSTKVGERFAKMIADGKGTQVFFELVKTVNSNQPISNLVTEKLRSSVWQESVAAAERHNQPGKFTAFIGWEWSSIPQGQNLHRIIFMPQGAEVANQFLPYSAFDSDVESDFWDWLDQTSKRTGADFVAIPHNGNISNGLMFPLTDRAGKPISEAYARTRMRWEPVIETTQIKGDSETHPALSPNDTFADYETFEHLIKTDDSSAGHGGDTRKGSYTRSGLMRGLEFEKMIGVNPFKYGMIGATDAHTSVATAEEHNFWGKFSYDSIPENKKNKEITPGAYGWDMSAAGLAGVWAKENTREAITAAFKRREVYGTSGPRIQLRMFAGWDFDKKDADAKDVAKIGYAKGVPMGGDLTNPPKAGPILERIRKRFGRGTTPSFLIHAVKDPKAANLDRVQVVKGWLGKGGMAKEKVFNIAWSGDRKIKTDGKLPPVGSTVDLNTGRYTNAIGAAQLATVWADPEFEAGQRAFYYVRVLQIPTPRNSTYDAIALGIDPKKTGKPVLIQERAYSSPVWYTP